MLATTASVKTELQQLVAQENDQRLLQVIKSLLIEPTHTALLRAKLTSRAFQAEEDIHEGRVFTHQEAAARLKLQRP